MLTGFHGAHVTLGALILSIMLIRILRGHFDAEHHFGFEAASWYWHFVDGLDRPVHLRLRDLTATGESEMPGRVAVQLAAVEAPGDQRQGRRGEHHADGQRIDHAGTMALVLTRKNRPLNRLTRVASSSRTIATFNMVGLRRWGFMQYSQRLGEAGRNDRRSMRGAFRPGLLPTLVVLGLLPVLLWLGTWQLQRADEKRALLAS